MKLGKISNALLLGASAVAFSTLANSADIDAPASDWTGFHVGVGAGYGMVDNDVSAILDSGVLGEELDVGLDGFGGEGALGTIEAGYDVQLNNNILLGFQADYTRSDIGLKVDADIGDPASLTFAAPDTFNVLARAGRIVDDSTLMYVLGGWTHSKLNAELTIDGNSLFSEDFTQDGWTVGSGVETAISNNITAKLEYRLTHYGNADLLNIPDFLDISSQGTEQTMRAVVSYHGGNVHAYQGSFANANWTGLHVGLGGGYGLVNHELSVNPLLIPLTLSGVTGKGFLGSIEAGFDYQASERFVVGLQGDYTRSNVSTDIGVTYGSAPVGSYNLEATDNFSILGRAGMLSSPNVLWFGEAGWTHTTFNGDLDIPIIPFSDSYDYSANGLTVGAGVEAKLTDNVSWKTEYRYTSYENKDIIPDILSADTNLQSVRSTISYRF